MDYYNKNKALLNINLSSEDTGVQDQESDSNQEEDQDALGNLAQLS